VQSLGFGPWRCQRGRPQVERMPPVGGIPAGWPQRPWENRKTALALALIFLTRRALSDTINMSEFQGKNTRIAA